MKKVMAICLATVLVLCMGVTAFAAPDDFVSSPSGTPAPGVVTFDPNHEDCTAELIVTPYADKDSLPAALLALFEKAYKDIVDSEDLSDLVSDLADLVAGLNIDGSDLSVSDFFFIHSTGCDYHDEHVDFDVTLDADTLSHFVGLLQMNADGKWELVKNAQVVNNGEHLQFTVDSYAPFAVVVNGSADTGLIAPQTGYTVLCISAVVMALSAAALGFVLVQRKKKED